MTYPIFEKASPHTHIFYMPVSLITLEEAIGSSFEDIEAHPYILIVWSGKGVVSLNEQQYVISRGSVLLRDATQGGEWKLTSHTSLQGILIGYRILTIDGSKQRSLGSNEPLHHCSSEMIRLSGKLESAWKQSRKSEPFRIQQLFVELLAKLYGELEGQSQNTSLWMEQVLHYVDTHFHEDVTREQMATIAQVSPEHFSRAFRRHTSQTFSDYLALLRIRASQNRLLYDMPKLEKLAQEVGYKEGAYLSRKFKQLVGLSPTAYHQKKKRVVALNSNHTACLLALGITPELGVYSSWMESINPVNPLQKLYEFGISTSSFYNTIASTRPDLIIDYYTVKGSKELLPLAPVLGLPFMDMSWREQFRHIADVVERQQQVEEWLAHYDEQIWAFNQKLDQQLGKRGTAVLWEIGTSSAYSIHSSHGRGSQILYEDIGFRPPGSLLKHGIEQRGFVEEEIEAIADHPADHIFITGIPSNPGTKKRMKRLFQSESWLKMEAIKQNRMYLIEQPDLFYGYDPLSSQAQLHELMRVLISQK